MKIGEEDSQVTLVYGNNRLQQKLPQQIREKQTTYNVTNTFQNFSRKLDLFEIIKSCHNKLLSRGGLDTALRLRQLDDGDWNGTREDIILTNVNLISISGGVEEDLSLAYRLCEYSVDSVGKILLCLAASPRHGILHYMFIEGMRNERTL